MVSIQERFLIKSGLQWRAYGIQYTVHNLNFKDFCFYFLAPCEEADWVGDGYCDDGNNHKDCNYDGGDCCGPEVDKKYCADCICHEDMENNATFQTRSINDLHAKEEGRQ